MSDLVICSFYFFFLSCLALRISKALNVLSTENKYRMIKNVTLHKNESIVNSSNNSYK